MAWNDDLEEGTPAYMLASTTAHTVRAVAGPGSGKSFAIKRRIARLIEAGQDPEKILAITFTRTAAQDLKREITSIGITGAELVHARTLHSHALKILMQTDVLERTGRKPRMVIDHEISPSLRDIDKKEYEGIKEKKKLLDSYLAAWACLQSDIAGFSKNPVQASFETDLKKWLTEHEGLLVGEVIPVAIDFLRNNPASPEIGKYNTILVDEYQDLNKSEQEFIKLIRGDASLVIVGDDDQSIYSFKYAHPEGIQEIESVHGIFEDITFDECRRCPQKVTVMASELVSKNTKRTLGKLVPHKNNHDGQVQIIQWKTFNEEIDGISKIIEVEIGKGTVKPEDILILTPRRRIGYNLRDKLHAAGLPVKSYFRESAITNDYVKRAYSLLNFLANPNDIISLRYLIGFKSTDFRKSQYLKLKEIATNRGINLLNVLYEILEGRIEEKGVKNLISEFRKIQIDIGGLKHEILNNPIDAFQNFFIKNEDDELEFYELNQLYKKAVIEEGIEKLSASSDFDEWYKNVFGSLQESIALPDTLANVDHIRIMSLHSSKGLSAKFVILCSMIDHLLPYFPESLSKDEMLENIQEQRRLFYVAVTRCKSSNDYEGRLIISSFTSIKSLEAVKMGIQSSSKKTISVNATRFIKEFGITAPIPILGNTLLLNNK